METRRPASGVSREVPQPYSYPVRRQRDWATPVMVILAVLFLLGIGGAMVVAVFPDVVREDDESTSLTVESAASSGSTEGEPAEPTDENGRIDIGDFEIKLYTISDPYVPTNELGNAPGHAVLR